MSCWLYDDYPRIFMIILMHLSSQIVSSKSDQNLDLLLTFTKSVIRNAAEQAKSRWYCIDSEKANLKAWHCSRRKLVNCSLEILISVKKPTSTWGVHYHEIHQPGLFLVEGSISCPVCFKLCLCRGDLGGGVWEVEVSTRSIMVFGPRTNNVRILWML